MTSLEPIATTLPRTIERRADFVAIGTHPLRQQQEIFHGEFQSQVHHKMNKRGLFYYGLLYDKYELPVNQYVIYLGSGKWTASTQILHPSLSYEYSVIALNEIDYKSFLKTSDPEEIIFAILGDFHGENKSDVVQNIIKSLKSKVKSNKKLQKYIQQLEILSNLRNLQPEIIKQLSTMSIHFDIEKDLRFQQGIEQGIEQQAEKDKRIFVQSLLDNTDFDNQKIALIVGISVDYVAQMRRV